MFSIPARISAVAGAALLAVMVALPASAATAAPAAPTAPTAPTAPAATAAAHPDNGSDCNPNPFYAVTECTTVLGSGLRISQITGIAISNVGYDITGVHIEIYGPHGKIHNCPNITLPPYESRGCTYKNGAPNANNVAGDYCSEAWQEVADNDYIKLSTECIDVHS